MDERELHAWMAQFVEALRGAFGSRLVFVGLQGSRGRGEAGPDSDIDVVVLLDRLDGGTLAAYEALTAALPHRELLCGFVSDADTLRAWDRADCFQFYYDTTAWLGSLDTVLAAPTRADAQRAAHTGACGVYHACCHNLLHAQDPAVLAELAKTVRFVLTARHFARTGEYLGRRAALRAALPPEEQALLEAPATGDQAAFRARSLQLLAWAGALVREGSGAP